jgi:hypothetical protein
MPAAVMEHDLSSSRLRGCEEKAQSIFDLYHQNFHEYFQIIE